MIKASEIRLGNLITDIHASEGSAFEVIKITPDRCYYGAKFHMQWKDIKGIELTPEWLERFGFDLVTVGDNPFDNPKMPYWVNEGVCLFFNEGEHNKGNYLVGVGDHRFAKYTAVTNRWISTVHTLQNVFHSWTGRELELKK